MASAANNDGVTASSTRDANQSETSHVEMSEVNRETSSTPNRTDDEAISRPPLDTFTTAQSTIPLAASGKHSSNSQSEEQSSAAPEGSEHVNAISTIPAVTGPAAASTQETSDASAIGPAPPDGSLPTYPIDKSTDTSTSAAPPAVLITLLLTSGSRHPYCIDEKYLRKQEVIAEGEEAVDPYTLKIQTLKELIWRDWRKDWEPRPPAPDSIRLISFGRMLDDEITLKDCRFTAGSPNIVHMTIKPHDLLDDVETTKLGRLASRNSRARTNDASGNDSGCRCCSMM